MQAHPLQGRGSETWPGASRDFSRAGWGPSALHHADSPHPNPSPEGEGLETEKNMTLRAAVQMDPMDNINIGGDSSFALILKALERGYELYHYDVRGLTWEAGRLTTKDRKSTRLNSSH